LPDRDGESGGDGPLLERDRRQWRPGKPVRLVQGPLGPLLADHSACANRRACGWWRRGKTCLRGNDADEENRHRHHRSSAARLTYTTWSGWAKRPGSHQSYAPAEERDYDVNLRTSLTGGRT